MKVGLTSSVIMHTALIGFGLFTLSAPREMQVADVEAVAVDIIPVESITQTQQGDKKAVMKEKPAPVPTKKPDEVPDAQKVGDNKVDTDTKPTPEPAPRPVEAAKAPAPAPEPKPDEKIAKEPVKEAEKQPAAAPATEVAPQPKPKEEVKPDPVTEAIAAAESPDAEAVKLPESAPSPEAKPNPPQAQTAKAPDRKEAEKPAEKQASKPKSDEADFNEEDIASLLNKQKPSGGGAKRSTQEASLGGEKNKGTKLSQGEMDALRGQIERCWNVPAGAMDAQNLIVVIKFNLTPAGEVDGSPEVVSGGGSGGIERAAAESARRAVLQCGPYTLPADKYDGDVGWNQVQVTFDPSQMF